MARPIVPQFSVNLKNGQKRIFTLGRWLGDSTFTLRKKIHLKKDRCITVSTKLYYGRPIRNQLKRHFLTSIKYFFQFKVPFLSFLQV